MAAGPTTPDDDGRLRVDGRVDRPHAFDFADLAALPAESQVPDLAAIQPARRGAGVALAALLDRVGVDPGATRAILHADRDGFRVALPLAALRDRGVVAYAAEGGGPLPAKQGGPFRMLVRDAAGCDPSAGQELDECANVKYLSRVELA